MTWSPSLKAADYMVKSVGTREKKRNPVAPFITSTLQQESSRKLRFSVKRTMMLAQRLYEGVEIGKEGAVGLITYMRTDSTRISDDAVRDVRHYIAERYGKEFLPESPNFYKSKKDAQDAHEAIRPTSMAFSPGSGGEIPGGRRDEALPAHLEPFRGQPDDAGAVRPDHHRCLRQG
jgi:DNA topoisomerase I